MPGVELTCEQESVVQQCYEIAAQLVNLKQVKKDSHKYENEYDIAISNDKTGGSKLAGEVQINFYSIVKNEKITAG